MYFKERTERNLLKTPPLILLKQKLPTITAADKGGRQSLPASSGELEFYPKADGRFVRYEIIELV